MSVTLPKKIKVVAPSIDPRNNPMKYASLLEMISAILF